MAPLVTGVSSGYLFALLQTLVALAGVSALAVLVLRWAGKRGFGRPASGRRLEFVERLTLEHGASVSIIRVDGRELLVGSAPGRVPALVASLDDVAASPSEDVRSYRSVDAASREKPGAAT